MPARHHGYFSVLLTALIVALAVLSVTAQFAPRVAFEDQPSSSTHRVQLQSQDEPIQEDSPSNDNDYECDSDLYSTDESLKAVFQDVARVRKANPASLYAHVHFSKAFEFVYVYQTADGAPVVDVCDRYIIHRESRSFIRTGQTHVRDIPYSDEEFPSMANIRTMMLQTTSPKFNPNTILHFTPAIIFFNGTRHRAIQCIADTEHERMSTFLAHNRTSKHEVEILAFTTFSDTLFINNDVYMDNSHVPQRTPLVVRYYDTTDNTLVGPAFVGPALYGSSFAPTYIKASGDLLTRGPIIVNGDCTRSPILVVCDWGENVGMVRLTRSSGRRIDVSLRNSTFYTLSRLTEVLNSATHPSNIAHPAGQSFNYFSLEESVRVGLYPGTRRARIRHSYDDSLPSELSLYYTETEDGERAQAIDKSFVVAQFTYAYLLKHHCTVYYQCTENFLYSLSSVANFIAVIFEEENDTMLRPTSISSWLTLSQRYVYSISGEQQRIDSYKVDDFLFNVYHIQRKTEYGNRQLTNDEHEEFVTEFIQFIFSALHHCSFSGILFDVIESMEVESDFSYGGKFTAAIGEAGKRMLMSENINAPHAFRKYGGDDVLGTAMVPTESKQSIQNANFGVLMEKMDLNIPRPYHLIGTYLDANARPSTYMTYKAYTPSTSEILISLEGGNLDSQTYKYPEDVGTQSVNPLYGVLRQVRSSDTLNNYMSESQTCSLFRKNSAKTAPGIVFKRYNHFNLIRTSCLSSFSWFKDLPRPPPERADRPIFFIGPGSDDEE